MSTSRTEPPVTPAAAPTGELHRAIAACRVCAAHLAAGPRPIVQFSATSRLVIIGQAPGSKVHASGIAWDDSSGDRLREWTSLSKQVFYDATRVALVPMGFCYPGKGASGDLPPRPECAPLWHPPIMAQLQAEHLTLLVGSYAQAHYLPGAKGRSMTERVRDFDPAGRILPLPHPAWRSTGWMARNPWFAGEILPVLRQLVAQALAG